MHRTNRNVDDVQLQRLVDGELSGEEYRRGVGGTGRGAGGMAAVCDGVFGNAALAQELGSVRRSLDLRRGCDGKAAKPTPVPIVDVGF